MSRVQLKLARPPAPKPRIPELERFAKEAGVKIVSCDAHWGGKFAYTTSDAPNCKFCGFRSEAAAYRHWLADTFGAVASKALLKLLARASDPAKESSK